MAEPRRIQRQRTKGWKAPLDENGLPPVYVGRPSQYGNVFRVGYSYFLVSGTWEEIPPSELEEALTYYPSHFKRFDISTPEDAAVAFEWHVKMCEHLAKGKAYLRRIRTDLRGRNVMCWCPEGSPCHADTLLAIANEATP